MTNLARDTHFPHWSSRRVMLRIVVLLSIINLISVYAAAASASTVPCTNGMITIDDTTHSVTSNSGCAGAVTIPTGVTGIGNSAFQGSLSLTSVTFAYPSHLTSIDRASFSETGLTSITIPESVASIGEFAFSRSLSLVSVYFEGKAPDAIGALAFSDLAESAKVYRFLGAPGFECSVPLRACTAGEHWPSANNSDPTIDDTPFPARPAAPTVKRDVLKRVAIVTVAQAAIGPAPTSFDITAHPGGETCRASGPSGSCMIVRLRRSTTYTFTAVAHNAEGTSATSAPSQEAPGVFIASEAAQNFLLADPTFNQADQVSKAALQVALTVGGAVGRITMSVVLDQRGAQPGGPIIAARATPRPLCHATKRIKLKHAGTVRLTCRYTKAARALLRRHTITVKVMFSFKPKKGSRKTSTSLLTLKRLH